MHIVSKQEIVRRNVAKAQPLVEASYNFNIWEKRVYTVLASLVNKDDPDFKMYRIKVKDIIDFYECSSHEAYERVREVPESLLMKKKILKIPYEDENGQKRMLKTPLITAITEPLDPKFEKDTYIELQFHPALRQFLLSLKHFLCYDIRNTVGIKSVHSLRIFEFLKLYEYRGKRRMKVEELKVMLGVEKKHKLYGHFKRIILKAQKDLSKHTDISFTFEEIKKGRAVHELIFYIFANSPRHKKPLKLNTLQNIDVQAIPVTNWIGNWTEEDPHVGEIIETLKKYNVKPNEKVERVLERAKEQSPFRDYVLDTLARCEGELAKKASKITNPAGYILNAISEDYHKTKRDTAAKVATKKTQKVVAAKKAKASTQLIAQYKRVFQLQLEEKLNELREKHQTEAAIKDFMLAHNKGVILGAMQASLRNGVVHFMLQKQLDRAFCEQYLQPQQYDFVAFVAANYQQKIQRIEGKYEWVE